MANKEKLNLLPKNDAKVKASKLTPSIGIEIKGLQLSELNDLQKDELALLIAERGVVIFRDQDFKDIGIEKQKAFGQYFGPLHIHVSNFRGDKSEMNVADVYPFSPSELMSRIISSSITSTWGQTVPLPRLSITFLGVVLSFERRPVSRRHLNLIFLARASSL